MNREDLLEFVEPFYSEKDEMHGLEHIERVLARAEEMAEDYDVDGEVLRAGCYLHGLVEDHEEKVREFLKENVSEKERERILAAAKGSLKDQEPETIEGKILHDAHLLEGGETFHIIKSLIAGKERGQSFMESIEYLEENILGEYECVFPENQEEYEKKEEFAREFIEKLKR